MGLNQVPFDLQPYFGSTFYETLSNVIGVEDLEEIGAKYIQQSGDWNIQAGYYLRPAWQGKGKGKGTSKGATCSSVVSEADSYVTDGSNNQERNTGSDELVTLGGYNGTYNVASRGNLYVADASYDVAGKFLFDQISGVKLYANYSAFDKSASDFKTSQRMILGASFSFSKLWIATEWLHGKNDPYIGGSSYTQSLGTGGSNQWENQLYTNIGYYF